jgi:hypothetical protein
MSDTPFLDGIFFAIFGLQISLTLWFLYLILIKGAPLDRGVTDAETVILARAVLRIIRVPPMAFTQAERRHLIEATVRLFRRPT